MSRLKLELTAVDLPRTAVALPNRETLIDLGNYFHGLAAGSKRASALMIDDAAVQASATATCAAVAGADTVTLGGIVFTATQRHATGTVTLTSIAGDATVTVDTTVFVAKASPSGVLEFANSGDDTADAVALVAKINAHPDLVGVVTATNSTNVVTIRAVATGTGGNSIALASSTEAVSAATLTNGAASSTTTFDFTGTDTQTAEYLVAAINSNTSTSTWVSAASVLGVVTITALQAGSPGNAITLVSSDGTRLAVTGSGRLASGANGTHRSLSL
jgi:hypothetical protein